MRFQEELPCQLSHDEVNDRAQQLARILGERGTIELEAKEIASRAKQRMKKLDRKSQKLAEVVRTGVEHRDVECIERRVYDTNRIEVVRVDTGECVRWREMTAKDRQGDLYSPSTEPDNDNAESNH